MLQLLLLLKFQPATSHCMALWFERIKASPKNYFGHEKIIFELGNQGPIFAQNTGIQYRRTFLPSLYFPLVLLDPHEK